MKRNLIKPFKVTDRTQGVSQSKRQALNENPGILDKITNYTK